MIIKHNPGRKEVKQKSTVPQAAATRLEGHLGSEDELVLLEESSGGVEEHAVRDGVDEGVHAKPHLVVRLRALDGLLEHHAERLSGSGTRASDSRFVLSKIRKKNVV